MKRQWATMLTACVAAIVACTSSRPVVSYVSPAPATDVTAAEEKTSIPSLPDGKCDGCHTDSISSPPACPDGTVEVDGEYCANVKEECLRWVDARGNTVPKPDNLQTGRCGDWKFPTECVGKRVHKHYCIDKFEYPNVVGQRPQSWMTWDGVKAACEKQGKRLCTKAEWEFACEGPDMQPYPYVGQGEHPGYSRDRTACNIDNPIPEDPEKPINTATGKRYEISVFDARRPGDRVSGILQDMLVPAGSMPACVSPFGVYDMVGNIDEFIEGPVKHHWVPSSQNGGKPDRGPFISGLMSGHVFGVRNQCRAITDGHAEFFGWYETGGRCCSDPHEDK